MVNPNPNFLSKRVKRKDQSGITSDRYQFLGLEQAEPDLGDPLVGPSSIGVNPYTGAIENAYILVADTSGSGKRYWARQSNVIAGGVVTPGSITVRNKGEIVGAANQITDVNFVGSGVTVINPASWVGAGSSSVDISITITDVALPSGPTGSVAYKDTSGLLQGSSEFIFDPVNTRVGIGSILPKEKLDVNGNVVVSGTITAGVVTAVSGTFTDSLKVGNFEISDSTTFVRIVSGSVGIGSTQPKADLDVAGDIHVSGIASISRIEAQNIRVASASSFGSVSIGNTQVISSSRQLQNIISLDPVTTATIESAIANPPNTFTDLNVIGVTTLSSLGVLGLTTTRDLRVTGVTTLSSLGVLGLTTTRDLRVTGVTTLSSLGVTGLTTTRDLRVTGVTTLSSLGVTGLTTTRDLSVIDTATIGRAEISNISVASSVGIGTTIARYNLDVNGDINLTGRLSVFDGGFGVQNQVLLSGGVGNPTRWGQPEGITVGSAASVGSFDVNDDAIYYPVFVPKTEGVQSVYLDSTGLSYNPAKNQLGIGTTSPSANLNVVGSTLLSGTNIFSGVTTVTNTLDINTTNLRYIPSTVRLGIGTTSPGSTLAVGGTITEEFNGSYWNVVTQADVGYGASQVPLNQFLGQLAFLDEYLPPQFRNTEVVTTSTSNVTIDSLDGNFERSAKYNIQITCNGQLIGSGTSSSSRSVTNLTLGQNYVSGNYTNIALLTTKGTGNDARANLTVTPEETLTLNAIQDGTFAFQENVSSLSVIKPIIFNQPIPASAAENSRVTSINTTNVGSGYTDIPTVTISNPTNTPSIPGVSGIGSTATAVVDTMVVTDFTLTQSGIHTVIPEAIFNGPVGVGSTALGIVGFGVSSIIVTSSGSNYSYIPSVSVPGNPFGTPVVAGVTSVFVTNVRVFDTGFGYNGTGGANYPTIAIQPPTSGTTAIATVTSLSLTNYYQVIPGIGYTAPPILTVASPIGLGTTAIVSSSLGIVTFTNISPGSGYTISPILSLSPNVTNFSAVVGMGVSQTGVQFTGGSGYSPDVYTIQFDPVGGIGTGAQAEVSFNVGGQLEDFRITNPGFGYTVPPIVTISGGSPSTVAVATITTLIFTGITIKNIGFGVTSVPSAFLSPIGPFGGGASASPVMGIGTVFLINSGSGYITNPSIAVTAVDGITGSGGSVTSSGLGVTFSNIQILNSGIGYTFVPTVSFSSPTGIGTSAIGFSGVGITQISVTNPGFGYSSVFPNIAFSGAGSTDGFGSGVGAAVSTIITTNIFVTNSGAGYTQFDLRQTGIVTFSPSGTLGIVGFGISEFLITNLGIGYTTAQSAGITISSPNLGTGTTATAIASLGFPGILPGPGYGQTTKIYYIAEIVGSNTLRLSTFPGIGTLSQTDVANVGFVAGSTPTAFAGGQVSTVSVVSPGSGYTSGSILSVTNTFDGGNVGSGFSFVASPVDNFQMSDVMLLQSNGSANPRADFIEYASLANEEILGSFSATMVAGSNPTYSANLVFTPTYRNNTIKISRDKFNV
jgi:hypothetical protein